MLSVGMIGSPCEGLKQFCACSCMCDCHIVGMIGSPCEGLKQRHFAPSVDKESVGMIGSPCEGLKPVMVIVKALGIVLSE